MDIKGDPKISPDNMTVDGHPIRGWAVFLEGAGKKVQRWMERYRPTGVPTGHSIEPLVAYSDIPKNVNPPAPAVRPPFPPAASGKTIVVIKQQEDSAAEFDVAKLKELRRSANMNKNMGATTIPLAFVMECLAKPDA